MKRLWAVARLEAPSRQRSLRVPLVVAYVLM